MTPDPTLVETTDEILPEQDTAAQMLFGGSSVDPADGAEHTVENDNGSLALLAAFVVAILAIGYFRTWWFPGIMAGLLFTLFMHELGHFVTARASGMKVTEFFVGFGPKIWSFNRGETEYGVKGIPAGAYVRIMGMTNLEDINPAEEHRTYRAQPYWQRMMTICAGSAVHFMMAFISLVVLFASFSYPGFDGPPWSVGLVAEGSTAETLGIEVGDEIVSINDDGFNNWDEFGEVIGDLEEGPIEILIERDGQPERLTGELGVRPDDVMYDGFGLIMQIEDPSAGWEASFVWPGDQADQFGIEAGDILLSAGGVEEPTQTTMAAMLRNRDGDNIAIDVLRRDEVVRLDGTVALNTTAPFRGFFGIGPQYEDPEDVGFGQSLGRAAQDFGTIGKTNIIGIADMVNLSGALGLDNEDVERRSAQALEQRRDAANQAAIEQREERDQSSNCNGPDTNRPLSVVGIGRIISCSESADQVIFLYAVVNIFVGIFNLLPVLPVDGGHAAMATYERVRGLLTGKRHRVDAAKLVPLTWLVVIGLVGLGLWTTILDIFSW